MGDSKPDQALLAAHAVRPGVAALDALMSACWSLNSHQAAGCLDHRPGSGQCGVFIYQAAFLLTTPPIVAVAATETSAPHPALACGVACALGVDSPGHCHTGCCGHVRRANAITKKPTATCAICGVCPAFACGLP